MIAVETWSRNWSQREDDANARTAALASVDDEAAAGRAFHAQLVARNRLERVIGSIETRLRDFAEMKRKAAIALTITLERELATVFYGKKPSVQAALDLAAATAGVDLAQNDLEVARGHLDNFDSTGQTP